MSTVPDRGCASAIRKLKYTSIGIPLPWDLWFPSSGLSNDNISSYIRLVSLPVEWNLTLYACTLIAWAIFPTLQTSIEDWTSEINAFLSSNQVLVRTICLFLLCVNKHCFVLNIFLFLLGELRAKLQNERLSQMSKKQREKYLERQKRKRPHSVLDQSISCWIHFRWHMVVHNQKKCFCLEKTNRFGFCLLYVMQV